MKLRQLVLAFTATLTGAGCEHAASESIDGSSQAAVDAGDASEPAPPELPDFLLSSSTPFPPQLSEVGLYTDLGMRVPAPWVRAYAPSWPLWSNGLVKERFVYAPQPIDNTDRESWRFADGTTFYKTFVAPGTSEPIETRIIRRSGEKWDYVAYRWNAEGSDATLLPPTTSIDVELEIDGSRVVHQIPSKLACRACHESAPSPVLGFEEAQLGLTLADHAELFVERPPDVPDVIEHEDARTRDVLGYLHGNCVPCHNGAAVGPNSSFDLRHDVALSNLIGIPTGTSGVESGIRVIPGNAAESVLIRAFARETADPMPPFGVQTRDDRALDMLTAWVDGLSR